jgi:hypothetical protein
MELGNCRYSIRYVGLALAVMISRRPFVIPDGGSLNPVGNFKGLSTVERESAFFLLIP